MGNLLYLHILAIGYAILALAYRYRVKRNSWTLFSIAFVFAVVSLVGLITEPTEIRNISAGIVALLAAVVGMIQIIEEGY